MFFEIPEKAKLYILKRLGGSELINNYSLSV